MDPSFVPVVPQLADVSTHEFVPVSRGILAQEDMGRWLQSSAATTLLNFISLLNQSVVNKKKSDFNSSAITSPGILAILKVLEEMSTWVNEIPPLQQAQRFGNKAFKSWYERLQSNANRFMLSILPEAAHGAAKELSSYLVESVGNSTRIDYGTGHELAFTAWMCGLHMVGVVPQEDFPLLVFHVFGRYLDIMRTLQKVYMMEPAGSHGVWGLDDFQFLPFLWGSAQFLEHPKVTPKSIMSVDMVEALAPDYLFMAGIQFIREMKKGPFAEHSPMLYDISAVPLWAKVNGGLHKMYAAEVLGKFPVVQHFLFGSLFTLKPVTNQNPFIRALTQK